MSLTIQVCPQIPTTKIDLIGRLVLGQDCANMRERVQEAIDHGAKEISINLAGVTYIDSCGLGELASNHAKAADRGVRLVLLNALGAVRSSIQISKLDTIIPVSQTVGTRETGSYVVQ